MITTAIILRNLSFIIIGVIAYIQMKLKNVLFYLAIIISAVGESFLLLGLKNFPLQVIICFIVYLWVLIILLNKSIPKLNYSIKKEQLVPLCISSFLVVYLIITVFGLISPGLKEHIVFAYIAVASFFITTMYIGILYVSAKSYRYTWLLFLMVTLLVTITTVSIDAYYYPSILLRKLACYSLFCSHYFLLKFLVSPDVKISYM